MEFEQLLMEAQRGNAEAKESLFLMYRPLLFKLAMIEGRFCEDLYQELSKTFLVCIEKFDVEKVKKRLE